MEFHAATACCTSSGIAFGSSFFMGFASGCPAAALLLCVGTDATGIPSSNVFSILLILSKTDASSRSICGLHSFIKAISINIRFWLEYFT